MNASLLQTALCLNSYLIESFTVKIRNMHSCKYSQFDLMLTLSPHLGVVEYIRVCVCVCVSVNLFSHQRVVNKDVSTSAQLAG